LRDLWNQPTAALATVYFKAWYRRVIPGPARTLG
jgi:hypothetical protein